MYRLRDGSLRALGAVCPHRGGPLADGLTDDAVVVCPLHNYAFDMCTGAEVSGSGLTVRSYSVRPSTGVSGSRPDARHARPTPDCSGPTLDLV